MESQIVACSGPRPGVLFTKVFLRVQKFCSYASFAILHQHAAIIFLPVKNTASY